MQFRINHPLCQLNAVATKKIRPNWRIPAFRPGLNQKTLKKLLHWNRGLIDCAPAFKL
jgi:hypothetical protein